MLEGERLTAGVLFGCSNGCQIIAVDKSKRF